MAIINSPAIWGITRELFDAATASWGRLSVERADEASGSIFFDNLPTSLKQGLLDSNGDADLSKVNALFNNKAQAIINGIVKFASILSKIEFNKLPDDPPTKEFLRDAVLLTIDFALVNSMREKVVSNTFQSSQYTIGQDLTNWLTAPDIMGTAAYDAFLNSKILQMKLVEDENGVLGSDGKKYLIQYQGTLYGFGKFKTGEYVSDYNLDNFTGGTASDQISISTTAKLNEKVASLFTDNVIGAEQDEDNLTYPTNATGYAIAVMKDQTPELNNIYSRNWLLSRSWFEKYVKPKIFKNKTDIAANLNAINNLNSSATSPQIEANRVKIDEIDKAVIDDGTTDRKKISQMNGISATTTLASQKIVADNTLLINANTGILNFKNVKTSTSSITKKALSTMDGVNDDNSIPSISYLSTYNTRINDVTAVANKNKTDIATNVTTLTNHDTRITQNSDNLNLIDATKIATNETNIAANLAKINLNIAGIGENTTRMTDNSNKINSNKASMDNNTSNINANYQEFNTIRYSNDNYLNSIPTPNELQNKISVLVNASFTTTNNGDSAFASILPTVTNNIKSHFNNQSTWIVLKKKGTKIVLYDDTIFLKISAFPKLEANEINNSLFGFNVGVSFYYTNPDTEMRIKLSAIGKTTQNKEFVRYLVANYLILNVFQIRDDNLRITELENNTFDIKIPSGKVLKINRANQYNILINSLSSGYLISFNIINGGVQDPFAIVYSANSTGVTDEINANFYRRTLNYKKSANKGELLEYLINSSSNNVTALIVASKANTKAQLENYFSLINETDIPSTAIDAPFINSVQQKAKLLVARADIQTFNFEPYIATACKIFFVDTNTQPITGMVVSKKLIEIKNHDVAGQAIIHTYYDIANLKIVTATLKQPFSYAEADFLLDTIDRFELLL